MGSGSKTLKLTSSGESGRTALLLSDSSVSELVFASIGCGTSVGDSLFLGEPGLGICDSVAV